MGLLFLMPVSLTTGILLECLHGEPFGGVCNSVWVWGHVVASLGMMVLVVWHVRLNWGAEGGWVRRLRKHRSGMLRGVFIFFLLSLLTGLAAVPQWLEYGHSGVGGLHGKIAFVGAFFMLWHLKKHGKWYLPS